MPERKLGKTLEERALSFIRENNLVKPGEVLLAGVSGGPDSTCLILILNELKDKLGIKLHVAHLNHGLRGAEAEADAQFVANLAAKLGLPVTIERQDVKAYERARQMSLEEAAREVRYTFFAELALRIGATKVAVGHTLNDHTETVLMHLVRGSGTRGLTGLRPSNLWRSQGKSITVIRPLLEISREETEDYCRNCGLTPRTDTTNLSLSTLRNRLRLELLPLLRQYNPEIKEALSRTAKIASDDIALIDEKTSEVASEVAQKTGDAVILNREKLSKLPQALKRSLLRWAIEELIGDVREIELTHIEDIMDVLRKPAGKSINLPRGLTFTNEYGRHILSKDASALSPYPPLEGEFPIKIPGETVIPGWRIKAELVSREKVKDTGITDDPSIAYLDADKVGMTLVVRSRRRGDRFQPLGMSEMKKVGEFMIDAKVSRQMRRGVPIVVSPSQTIWLVGLRIDERVKVSEKTKRILRLRFERRDTT